jgi:hypothetical protein
MPQETNATAGDNAEEKAMTRADIEALVDGKLSKTVHTAITDRFKRLKLDQLDATITGILEKTLPAALAKALPKGAKAEAEPEAEAEAEQPEVEAEAAVAEGTAPTARRQSAPRAPRPAAPARPEVDTRVADLTKRLADIEQQHKVTQEQLKTTAREREQERVAARNEKGYNALASELAGKFQPKAIPTVVDLLKARGRVKIGDDGAVTLRVRAPLEQGLPAEDRELPLAEAIPHLVAEDELSFFVPPPSRGAGARSDKAPPYRSAPSRTPVRGQPHGIDYDEAFKTLSGGVSLSEALAR